MRQPRPHRPKGPVQLRRATPADLDTVLLLHQEAFPAGVAFGGDVLRLILGHPHGVCVLADAQGGASGFAAAIRSGPATASLWTLHVRAGSQRQGVGSMLLAHVEASLRAQGVRRLALQVWQGNVGAVSFYERHGYARTGVNEDAFAGMEPAGAWEMEKGL